MPLKATLLALFALEDRDSLLPGLELSGWSQEAAVAAFGQADEPRFTLLRVGPDPEPPATGGARRDRRLYRQEEVWIDLQQPRGGAEAQTAPRLTTGNTGYIGGGDRVRPVLAGSPGSR